MRQAEGINAVNDMEVTSNDRVIVAGHVSGSLTDRDWELGTAAYLGATGEELWKASTGFPRADFEMLNGVASSPDGATAYVTGFSRVQNRQDARAGEETCPSSYGPAEPEIARIWWADARLATRPSQVLARLFVCRGAD